MPELYTNFQNFSSEWAHSVYMALNAGRERDGTGRSEVDQKMRHESEVLNGD